MRQRASTMGEENSQFSKHIKEQAVSCTKI